MKKKSLLKCLLLASTFYSFPLCATSKNFSGSIVIAFGKNVKQLKYLPLGTEAHTQSKLNHSRFIAQNSQKLISEKPSNESKPSETEAKVFVSKVVVSGAEGKLEDTVYKTIKTKPGRTTTRSKLEEDINAIFATGFFSNVQPLITDTPLGVRITFKVWLNPILSKVQIEANPGTNLASVLQPGTADEIFQEQYGKILNLRDLQEGVRKIIKRYQDQGYMLANIIESPQEKNGIVTLQVAEGVIEDIQVRFVNEDDENKDKKGETISGKTPITAILKQIDLKPGSVYNSHQAQKSLKRLFSLGVPPDRLEEKESQRLLNHYFPDLFDTKKELGFFKKVHVSFSPGKEKSQVIVFLNVVENDLADDAEEILKYQQESQTAQTNKNRIAEAQALKELGYIYGKHKEHYEDGVKIYQKALQVFQEEDQYMEVAKIYNTIGNIYDNYNKYKQAISNFKKSLKIYRRNKHQQGEAISLNNLGNAYKNTNQYQNAIDSYRQARKIFSYINKPLWEAITINNLALYYLGLDEKDKSIELYNQALSQFQNLKQNPVCPDRKISEVLKKSSRAFFETVKLNANIPYINRRIMLLDSELPTCFVDSRFLQILTLLNIIHIYQSSGDYQQALYYYSNALSLLENVKNDRIYPLIKEDEETSLKNALNSWLFFNISTIYEELSSKQLRKQYKQKSLYVAEQEITKLIDLHYSNIFQYDFIKTPLRRITSLIIWQYAIIFLGETQQENNFKQVLEEVIQESEHLIQVIDKHNFKRNQNQLYVQEKLPHYIDISKHIYSAENLAKSGKKHETIESYNQALIAIQELKKEDLCLRKILSSLLFKNDEEVASTTKKIINNLCLSKTIEIAEAQILGWIAKNQLDLQQNKQAFISLRLASSKLNITDKSIIYKKDQNSILNLALSALLQIIIKESKDKDKQENLEQQYITELVKSPILYFNSQYSKNVYLEILPLIAKAHRANKEYKKALEMHNSLLKLWQDQEDIFKEADTYLEIATTERQRGNLIQARAEIEKAIAMIESERAQVKAQEYKETQDDNNDEDTDSPKVWRKQSEYKYYIKLAKYLESKQNYYDFYIDLLMQKHQQNPSAGYDIEALQASERSHARSLLATINRNSPNAEDKAQTTSSSNPNYIELAKPPQLKKIQQQLLDDNTLLLEYTLGEERSYLWAVTKNSITTYELPKKADIEAAAKQFYDFLTIPSLRIRPKKAAASGAKLSQMLLGPISHQMGNKRLLIVANGILQYIPFSALPVPNSMSLNAVSSPAAVEPLLVKHEIINLPSASILAVIRRNNEKRQSPTKTLAILADPIFSKEDERLKSKLNKTGNQPQQKLSTLPSGMGVKSNSNLVVEQLYPRLPNTRKEAKEIASLIPPSEQLQKFDFAASRKAVLAPEFSQYRYIHFATHGTLDSQNPERSGVVLSLVNDQGEFQRSLLSTPDFFKLNLSADLVTLSGCRTGLGQQVKGEGLIGITGGLMYSGAKRVMVSLWSVDDRATKKLMKHFYQGVLTDKLPPAKALQAAQLAMWQQQQWQNPYYWAAFTIQGEWK